MYDIYKVIDGESLSMIAKKLQISEIYLRDLNNLDFGSSLRKDQELIVPKVMADNYFEYYTISKGDTLYAIAKKYNINPELLASLNGLDLEDYIYPGQEMLIPKAGYSYYITKEGDTIANVLNVFDISKDKLLNNNKTIYLLEGQLLVNKK